jgi:hypothetical protein
MVAGRFTMGRRRLQPGRFKRMILACCLCLVGMLAGIALPIGEAGALTGLWAISPSSGATGDAPSLLAGVSCLSSVDCTAVGNTQIGSTQHTLIEAWNGTAWSVVPGPTNSTGSLRDVSCASASRCVAVGTTSTEQTLAELWDGSVWSIVASPNLSPEGPNFLVGVSCPSLSRCTAVGYAQSGTTIQTLVESWNGTAWSIVSSPNSPGSSSSVLIGVSCPSVTVCTAVGDSDVGSNGDTLVEEWNGSSWSIVPSPNASSFNSFDGVSCPTPTECTAVGGGATGKTLIEQWNGSVWSVVASPNVGGTTQSYLNGVSCVNQSECTAVGDTFTGTGYRTLIESWDGSAWTIIPSPNERGSRSSQDQLLGVSCPDSTKCTAVGSFGNKSAATPLIETGFFPVSITTVKLPNGIVGQPYSATLQATGGNPPYTWGYARGGDFPKGLHLSTAGVLSGTPKNAGSFSVTFRTKDTKLAGYRTSGATAVLTITIDIAPQ